jgi:hypothetical protein
VRAAEGRHRALVRGPRIGYVLLPLPPAMGKSSDVAPREIVQLADALGKAWAGRAQQRRADVVW